MMRLPIIACLVLLTSVALGDERILEYRIEIDIARDGSLEVAEHITVRAEGTNIRRGIYRDFPTRYRDRFGNRVVVDLDVLEVLRNGEPEPWFTENAGNGVRINTGDDSFLPRSAQHTFTIRYRTNRQLGFFANHDELYWNAIGTGWIFPIDAATVIARLPEPVDSEQLSAEGYTGREGAQGQDYVAQITGPGAARWELTRGLAAGEGLTIVLTFPKGIVTPPSATQRLSWLLKDNRGVLVALLTLVVFVVYCVREFHRIGRDPRKGIVIARYEPPAGHTPASLRFVNRMRYDIRCFSSEILALAVAGFVEIDREHRLLRKDDWKLRRGPKRDAAQLPASQRALLGTLFATKDEVPLKQSQAHHLQRVRKAHWKALDEATHPRYFKRNSHATFRAFLIGAIGIALANFVAGGAGMIAIVMIAVLMGIGLLIFAYVVRAPTLEGRALMDEIEGLKLYLKVAERDELARMQGPDAPPAVDPERYEHLLPYAVALEVEDAWTKKLIAAVGAAAAAETAQRMSWYHGSRFNNLGDLSKALGTTLSSQIASSSSPPGSSSGAGGGGSVGGGGGGGGGGGR